MSTRSMVPALEGTLVRLRAPEQADLSGLNAMFNEADVSAGLQRTFPQANAGIREWAERSRGKEDGAVYVIETLESRKAIGICGLEGIDARARHARFGIWIGKPFWRRGYGTDATRTACRFGFHQMNLQRIALSVYETNPHAIRAYEKVGFVREGTSRRGQFLGGRNVDVIEMGLLAHELVDV
jgi:RimJ/RimL family protein N-acetyltransferase